MVAHVGESYIVEDAVLYAYYYCIYDMEVKICRTTIGSFLARGVKF